MLKQIYKFSLTGSWLYLSFLWAGLLLRAIFADKWWWLGFANFLTLYWFLPLLIIIPLALVGKKRGLFIVSGTSTAVFLLLFSRLFLPNLPASSTDTTLTIMSYNLLGTNQDWPAIQAAILASNADIVALQELNREMADSIRQKLVVQYPYQILDTQDSLISRFPITLTRITLPGNWGSPPQIYLADFKGEQITLINAHFYASVHNYDRPLMDWVFREREEQARIVGEFAAESGMPTIVAADFNATDQSKAYHIMTDELADAWGEAGLGLGHTFPGGPSPGVERPVLWGRPFPMWVVRIDYIFYSDDWTAVDAALGEWDGTSDHRPVIAKLALK
jgi:endonuclease/exonuclease/phosphatase (EEP) superfamily protein YafD